MELSILIANISRLREENNISVSKMEQAAGLKKGFMDNLKKDSMPSVDKVVAVADYFQVSVDWLVGREGFLRSGKLLDVPEGDNDLIPVYVAAKGAANAPDRVEFLTPEEAAQTHSSPTDELPY